MRLRAIIKSIENEIRKYDTTNTLRFGDSSAYILFYHDQWDGSCADLANIDFEVAKPANISVYYLTPQSVPRFRQVLYMTNLNTQAALTSVSTLAYYCNGKIITKPTVLRMPDQLTLGSAAASPHKCHCDIRDLMVHGCKCKGV